MKSYSSFLVRCWTIRETPQQQSDRSVLDIEHIQSGEHRRVASFSEAEDWFKSICHTAEAGAESRSVEKTEE